MLKAGNKEEILLDWDIKSFDRLKEFKIFQI
jgi:hypothetical protein